MAVPLAIPLVMAGVGIATGVIGLFKAKSQREDAEAAAEQAKKEITMFDNGRDAVINPYP